MITEKINGKDVSIYVWPNPAFPFYYYLNHNKCRVFIIENISHNFLWLKEGRNYIRPTDYFFVLNGFYADKYVTELARIVIEHLKIDKKRFIVFCNDCRELSHFLYSGFTNSIILNQNAWLDERVYKILNTSKIYDAILIGRQSKFKRLYLANKVKNLALVTGKVDYGNIDLNPLPPHVNNDNKRLGVDEIIDTINKSNCGLCLSKTEGACYSSSEYLLCGVPVVSTQSFGGRDIWYTEENSIMCDDNEDDVANAVEQIKSKAFNPEKIRASHILVSKYFRSIFANKLKEIFQQNNITDIDAEQYHIDNYIDKMKKSSTNEEVISFLKQAR